LKHAEWCRVPVDWADDDRHNDGLAAGMPFKGISDLCTPAVVGSDEIGADKEEDNPRTFEFIFNRTIPFIPWG
jgi:hypothetical protein